MHAILNCSSKIQIRSRKCVVRFLTRLAVRSWEGSCKGDASAAVVEVACAKGQDLLREVRIGRGASVLARTRFHIREAVPDIEFRIRLGPGDIVTLKRMELRFVRQSESDAKTTGS
jgi:hypothetical protein